jgi:hypothetical protein
LIYSIEIDEASKLQNTLAALLPDLDSCLEVHFELEGSAVHGPLLQFQRVL